MSSITDESQLSQDGDDAAEDSVAPAKPTATPHRKILSYLGELRMGDSVPVMRMIADLNMVYGTASMYVNELIDLHYVQSELVGSVLHVRLQPMLEPGMVITLTAEWRPEFGTHPYEGATAMQRRRGRYTTRA